jgi:predicted SprT family Zn-dependent metalloprotease
MNIFAAFRKPKSQKPLKTAALGVCTSTAQPPPPPHHHPAPELARVAAARLAALKLETLAKNLTVFWNPKMRSTAGLAYTGSTQIVLNPRLIHFGPAEVERTLFHELAHLVAHHRCGRRKIAPHGPEWRQACCDLGLPNEARCHDLPLPRRKLVREFLYQCPQCKSLLERVRAFRRPAACMGCCKKYTAGRSDERFKLVRVRRLPAAETF